MSEHLCWGWACIVCHPIGQSTDRDNDPRIDRAEEDRIFGRVGGWDEAEGDDRADGAAADEWAGRGGR